ncbi:MAG: YciI family protein [Actinomycetales bacterium]
MKYLLQYWSVPSDHPAPDSPEGAAEFAAWMEFERTVREAGVHIAGEALAPVGTATTVTRRSGSTQLTDGPFAETKEVLGGFHLLDVADLDAALAWAERSPGSTYGLVEVRPAMVFDNAPAGA